MKRLLGNLGYTWNLVEHINLAVLQEISAVPESLCAQALELTGM